MHQHFIIILLHRVIKGVRDEQNHCLVRFVKSSFKEVEVVLHRRMLFHSTRFMCEQKKLLQQYKFSQKVN